MFSVRVIFHNQSPASLCVVCVLVSYANISKPSLFIREVGMF